LNGAPTDAGVSFRVFPTDLEEAGLGGGIIV